MLLAVFDPEPDPARVIDPRRATEVVALGHRDEYPDRHCQHGHHQHHLDHAAHAAERTRR